LVPGTAEQVEHGVGGVLLLEHQPVPENDCRPGSLVSNVEASEVLSTSAVVFSKPSRPAGISVDWSRVPALSSVVVGAAMLAMVGTNATRVCRRQ
jgi:hypothetical protein